MQKRMTIARASELLNNGSISSEELTQEYLKAIQKYNTDLNAYVLVSAEEALTQARVQDNRRVKGEMCSLLTGIPMSLKDNISTKGIKTECCSKILQNYIPFYDASVWKTLKDQGAVLLGKTNMDEFAMGSSSENSCHGGSNNPYDLKKVAGGSSGGAAAAVCAGLSVYALGSDTGGSIRQPASFCGVVGLKPTYGSVSRYGLIAYASSFDQIGPITANVEDAAIVFEAISEKDPMDSTCVGRMEKGIQRTLRQSIKGMKIGIIREFYDGISEIVQETMEKAMHQFEELGAQLVEINIPLMKYALPVYYILASAEAASNLGRYDGIRYGYRTEHYSDLDEMICKTRSEGFGTEVKRRILLGNYVLSAGYFDAYYKKAQRLRGDIVKSFTRTFEYCDILLTPTVPMTAFPKLFTQKDTVQTYLTDICTVVVNIAGLPAISIPCGWDAEGMPIGLQLIGARFKESQILNAAWNFEAHSGNESRIPDMGVQW